MREDAPQSRVGCQLSSRPSLQLGKASQSCFSNLSLASEPVVNCHSFGAPCFLLTLWKSHIDWSGHGPGMCQISSLGAPLIYFIKWHLSYHCLQVLNSCWLTCSWWLVVPLFTERGVLLSAGTGSQSSEYATEQMASGDIWYLSASFSFSGSGLL